MADPDINTLIALSEEGLAGLVSVQSYEYTSCYLWHDRPLYDEFGDKIKDLRGDTIYLYEKAASPKQDLFHELGHLFARKHNLVGHSENGYNGSWEYNNQKLIAQVTQQTHWSAYLNLFSVQQEDFSVNAASELWAELFMLYFLHPDYPETTLIKTEIETLKSDPICIAITALAEQLRLNRL